MNFCIDFFLPKPVTIPGYKRHEYKGKEGHVLTKKELSRFVPVLPERGKPMKLKFMPVHHRTVLISKKGLVHEIERGGYGAGEWFVVEQGEAKIIKRDGHFLLSLGERYFRIVPAYGDYLLVRR